MPSTTTWTMRGNPWTKAKMVRAVELLDRDGKVSFDFGWEKAERLLLLDEILFQARPDLVLNVASATGLQHGHHPLTDEELELVTGLRHVKKLDLHCNARKELAILSAMPALASLRVSTVRKLDLSFLAGHKKLRSLELHGQFTDLEPISGLKQLRKLWMGTSFESLEFLRGLDKLARVWLNSRTPIADFSPLNQPSLRELHLCDIRNLTDVSTLAGFGGLRTLKLSAPKVERLPDMKGLESLRRLDLDGMKSWANPDVLSAAPSLRDLQLRHINKKLKAEEFFFLTEMPTLKKVDFLFMDGQKRVLALRDRFVERGKKRLLPKGEAAEFMFQEGPAYEKHEREKKKSSVSKNRAGVFVRSRLVERDRDRLARYCDAKTLTMESIKADSLDFLVGWTQLEDLKMYRCHFGDCSALAGLEKLKHLFINGVRSKEADLSYLSDLHSLETLGIGWVSHLTRLPDLSRCKQLRWLDLVGWKRLEDLSAVLKIPNLRSFGICQTPLMPEDLEPIMRKPGLKAMSGAFGSRKADERFCELLKKHELAYGAGPR